MFHSKRSSPGIVLSFGKTEAVCGQEQREGLTERVCSGPAIENLFSSSSRAETKAASAKSREQGDITVNRLVSTFMRAAKQWHNVALGCATAVLPDLPYGNLCRSSSAATPMATRRYGLKLRWGGF
jgi:hypothetical protein